MQAVLEDAVEENRRKLFLRRANATFARLRRDHIAWDEEQTERKPWTGCAPRATR